MPRQRKPGMYGPAPARPDQQGATDAIRQTPNNQPLSAPTGLPYGQRSQLLDAQRVVPLPNAGGIQAGAPAGGGNAQDQVVAYLREHPPPNVTPLGGPSMRPNEPSTAGLSSGPGPGPEALAGRGAPMKASQFWRTLYEQTGDEEYARLAEQAISRGT